MWTRTVLAAAAALAAVTGVGGHRRHERRARICDCKVRFASQLAAIDAAVQMGLTYYRCPFCGGWHLTQQGTGA